MQLTIEIPEELARRLEPERSHLVDIIWRGLGESAPRAKSAVDEVVQFLARRPSPVEVIAFHASDKAQTRLRFLLDKNRDGWLTEAEEAELDTMQTLDELVMLVKLQARGQAA